MPKHKLLIVSDFYVPHWTGIVSSLHNLCLGLSKDLDISIITVQHDKSLSQSEVISNLSIIRIPYQFSLSRLKYSLLLNFYAIQHIQRSDSVLINSPCSNMAPISLIAKLFGKPVTIFHQGDLILPKGIFNRLLEIVFDLSAHLSCSLAKTISTYTLDYAQHSRILSNHSHKVKPFIMPLNISTSNKQIPVLNKLKSKRIIGFAGRFVEEKGFDILLNAIPKVIAKHPDAHFVFAGETKIYYEISHYKSLKSKIKHMQPHLSLLGKIDREHIGAFYKSLDLIIIPSRSDCFNMVQAEAMFLGVPSVVTDIPGARFLVKNTGYGMIARPNDSISLAQTICTSLEKRDMLIKNHAKVLKILDDDKNTQTARRIITTGN